MRTYAVTEIKSLDIDNNNIGVYKTIITSYELKAKQDTANIAKERLSKIDEKIESRGSKD